MKINNDIISNVLREGSKYLPEMEKVKILVDKQKLSITTDCFCLLFDSKGMLICASSIQR